MLPRRINLILCFFDVLGQNTESTKLSIDRKFQFLVYSFQFTHATILTFYKFYYLLPDLFALFDSIGVVYEFIQYIIGWCTYWLIIFDSIRHWEEHRQFWIFYSHVYQWAYIFCLQFVFTSISQINMNIF